MAQTSDKWSGGRAAVAAGAAIGSAAIVAALLYARRTVRKDVPPMQGIYPASTEPPESD